ncbi:hypothetical protein IE53DRAFT_337541 [Violaceomyces palustris]|uniref:Uncharacterized protein n=1 Tax=Violaceomyces palustris TaxID=1673888 RepID=A0ACD0P805_9BASI|nr:hypothetical protein IE53DRAFT_337541 [Violaceomyces palustris]
MTSSNQLLDLLAGASNRLTSPPTSPSPITKTDPAANNGVSKDARSLPSSQSFNSFQHLFDNASQPKQQATPPINFQFSSQGSDSSKPLDANALLAQFMGGANPGVPSTSSLTTNQLASSRSQPELSTQLGFVSERAPPKVTPQDVSRKADSSQREQQNGSGSKATMFDFISPFDVLEKGRDGRVEALGSQATVSESLPAATEPQEAARNGTGATFGDYQAASQSIANLLGKLSASAAKVDSTSPPPLWKDENPSVVTSANKAAQASLGNKDDQRQAPSLPPAPRTLDASKKLLFASQHAAALHSSSGNAFEDPKSSGLSILSPSRSSSAPRVATLDLLSHQPGGPSSLYPAKLENTPVAILASDFSFRACASAGGLFSSPGLASLGSGIICYPMSKGKIRIIDTKAGSRLLLQSPTKVAIRSMAAFKSPPGSPKVSTYLLAALTEKSKESGRESLVIWRIPHRLEGGDEESTVLTQIEGEASENPQLNRFSSLAWHPTDSNHLAISTSSEEVIILNLRAVSASSNPASKLISEAQARAVSDRVVGAKEEHLSALAFSPDGSLLATLTTRSITANSWSLRFSRSSNPGAAGWSGLTIPVSAPIQEALVVSHLTILGHGEGSQGGPRGVLVGFQQNTLLGLFDIAGQCWKSLWNFTASSEQGHFNLVAYDDIASTVIIASSLRSSLFFLNLGFDTLPPLKDNLTPIRDSVALPARLKEGSLPWTIRCSNTLKECPVPEPCINFCIPERSNSQQMGDTVTIFASNPAGSHILHIPRDAIGSNPSATSPSISPLPATSVSSSLLASNEAKVASAESTLEPTRISQSGGLLNNSTTSPAGIETPATLSDASESKKSKKAKAKKGATSKSSEPPTAEPTLTDKLTTGTVVAKPSGLPRENGVKDAEAQIEEKSGDLGTSVRELGTGGKVSIPNASSPPFTSDIQSALSAMESRISGQLQTFGSSIRSVDSTDSRISSAELQSLARHMVIEMNTTLFPYLNQSVKESANEKIAKGIQEGVTKTLPVELKSMLLQPDITDHVAKNITKAIVPTVQRTAVEVVSKVLAPHFEDVIMDLCDRMTGTIKSEITAVRKSIEPIQAPRDSPLSNESDAAVKDMAAKMNDMLVQLQQLTKANQLLEDQIKTLSSSNRAIDPSQTEHVQSSVSSFGSFSGSGITAGGLACRSTDSSNSTPTPTPRRKRDKEVQQVPLSLTHASTPKEPHKSKAILPETVAVVGAGPVGCLVALALAERGCKVDIYESRPDPRTSEAIAKASQRSINLAISTRGLTGLSSVTLGLTDSDGNARDLADIVLEEAVPMRARMIHTAKDAKSGNVKLMSQLYGPKGECINSVDRSRLNNLLLDRAVEHKDIKVHFECRLQQIDFDADSRRANGHGPALLEADLGSQPKSKKGLASSPYGGPVKLTFDSISKGGGKNSVAKWAGLVVGCDGAHSAVRTAMGTVVRMGYSHEYIDNGYVELSIPPRTPLGAGARLRGDGEGVRLSGRQGGHDAFHMDPGHLHIWPRHEFMLIALPNRDGSFTCTLFAPFNIFKEHLSTREGILDFFNSHFSDAVPLIGEEALVNDLLSRRPSPLGSVKCKPYHYKDRAILIGDAAHAILPFYGQGLNCGFEDVRVLMEIVDSCAEKGQRLEDALETYTNTRHPDLMSINQLALANYEEMASRVVRRSYLWRKRLDSILMSILPSSLWSSLYSMVTFSNLGYAKVLERERRQSALVQRGVWSLGLGSTVGLGLALFRYEKVWRGWMTSLAREVARISN